MHCIWKKMHPLLTQFHVIAHSLSASSLALGLISPVEYCLLSSLRFLFKTTLWKYCDKLPAKIPSHYVILLTNTLMNKGAFCHHVMNIYWVPICGLNLRLYRSCYYWVYQSGFSPENRNPPCIPRMEEFTANLRFTQSLEELGKNGREVITKVDVSWGSPGIHCKSQDSLESFRQQFPSAALKSVVCKVLLRSCYGSHVCSNIWPHLSLGNYGLSLAKLLCLPCKNEIYPPLKIGLDIKTDDIHACIKKIRKNYYSQNEAFWEGPKMAWKSREKRLFGFYCS